MGRYYPHVRPVKGSTIQSMKGYNKFVYCLTSIAKVMEVDVEFVQRARDRRVFDPSDLKSVADFICQREKTEAQMAKMVLELEETRKERDIYRKILEREIGRKQMNKFRKELEDAGVVLMDDDGGVAEVRDEEEAKKKLSVPVVIVEGVKSRRKEDREG